MMTLPPSMMNVLVLLYFRPFEEVVQVRIDVKRRGDLSAALQQERAFPFARDIRRTFNRFHRRERCTTREKRPHEN